METDNVRVGFIINFSQIFFCCLIVFIGHNIGNAQTIGNTSAAAAQGSPLGSYSLSNFENINLFNGTVNFNLPLATLAGRGNTSHTSSFTIRGNNFWGIEQMAPVGTGVYELPKVRETGITFDAGHIELKRTAAPQSNPCNPSTSPEVFILSTFTFYEPDGTERTLVDQATLGRSVATSCGITPTPLNRGRIFISRDRSITFVTDSDIVDGDGSIPQRTGTLHFKDGTVYRFNEGNTWIRDKNGNITTYTYTDIVDQNNHDIGRKTLVTDSLKREIIITSYYDSINNISNIVFKGFGGAQRTIKFHYNTLDQALVPGETIKTLRDLFIDINYHPTFPNSTYNPQILSAIEYSNTQSIQFFYNSYGEVARILLPTGSGYDYHYDTPKRYGLMFYDRLQSRNAYKNLTATTPYYNPPSSLIESKTSFAASQRFDLNPTRTIVTVKHKDGNDVLLSQESHEYYGDSTNGGGCGTAWPPWHDGREYKTETYLVSNGSVVGIGERTEYSFSATASDDYGTCFTTATMDPQIIRATTTLADVGIQSMETYAYDGYGSRTDTWEYDYGSGSPGPLLRHTHTTYLTTNPNQGNVDYTDPNIHIRNLPAETSVFNSNGDLVSKTIFEYDKYDVLPLQDAPNIVQHDNVYNTSYQIRGNLVKLTRYSTISPDTTISTYNQYDIAGNVVKNIDGRGNVAIFDFTDRYGAPAGEARSNIAPSELAGGLSYAFPTLVTNALGHQGYTKYDYYLGRPVDVEDANGIVVSSYYNDSLDRSTQVILAANGTNTPSNKNQTTITYDDINQIITTTKDLNAYGDNLLKSQIVYDSFGRPIESRKYENSTSYIAIDTQYDALGRPYLVSDPYRSADPINWTSTLYDSFGRVVSITTPDGASINTSYSGNQITMSDQALKQRKSVSDALGRLSQVIEDPSGLNYQTFYSYDALGNLILVRQGGQTRTFTYDSLSRLTSTINPENGKISYSYDPNNNLIQKTDARGVISNMTYDALNRIQLKTYSVASISTPDATTAVSATSAVNYYYDDYSKLPSGAPSLAGGTPKGRLIGATYGGGAQGTYYQYDTIGRIAKSQQLVGAGSYPTTYTYNLASGVLREQRKNRINAMTYDSAGRLASISSSAYPPFTAGDSISNSMQYTAFGGLTSENYGNGLIHSILYNNRHQPKQIGLGTQVIGSVIWLNYIYGTVNNPTDPNASIDQSKNNGNIGRIEYSIGNTLQYTQTYQYDGVNRLQYGVEHNNSTLNDGGRAWYQTFQYDQFGNRGIDVTNSSYNADASKPPLQLSNLSSITNQITRPGFSYDSMGNLISEPGIIYTYDAENRLVTATVQGGATSQYVYDSSGRRVKKIIANGITTRYVYGASGELQEERNDAAGALIKEYIYRMGELIATKVPGQDYQFATSDNLGSPRVWTDKNGNVISSGRHDYMPFGEEIFAGTGTRTPTQGYGTNTQQDGQRKQFTSKERDVETGLDYFGERYYSSVHGRFISVDPLTASARPGNPQTWNRFVYVLNNPLRYIDPDGLKDQDAWGQLTDAEQRLVAQKIQRQEKVGKDGKSRLETPQEAFNRAFQQKTKEETAALVITIKNFLDVVGAHSNSAIWQQIKSIEGGWPDSVGNKIHGALHIEVNNRDTFLKTLEKNGYDVDHLYEAVNRDKKNPLQGNHQHSARHSTDYPDQISMHFVQQKGYPDGRFDVHFDPKSSSFRYAVSKGVFQWNNGIPTFVPGRVLDKISSGLAHDDPKYFQSSAEQRQKLKEQGLVPKN